MQTAAPGPQELMPSLCPVMAGGLYTFLVAGNCSKMWWRSCYEFDSIRKLTKSMSPVTHSLRVEVARQLLDVE